MQPAKSWQRTNLDSVAIDWSQFSRSSYDKRIWETTIKYPENENKKTTPISELHRASNSDTLF